MSEKQSSSPLAMVVGLAAAALATWLASTLVKQSWKAVRGRELPKAEDAEGAALGEVLIAAALSGAAAAVARAVATRGTARFTADRTQEPVLGDD